MWAFAKLELRSGEDGASRSALRTLTRRALAVMLDFKAQELANAVWAFGSLAVLVTGDEEEEKEKDPKEQRRPRLEDSYRGFPQHAARRAHALLREFTEVHLATVIWGLAKMSFREGALMSRIMAHVSPGDLDIESLVSVVWAFARAMLPANAVSLGPALEKASGVLTEFSSRQMAAFAWALTWATVTSEAAPLLWRICDVVQPEELTAAHLTGMLWALAKAVLRHSGCLEAAGRAVEARIQSFDVCKELVGVAWAFAGLRGSASRVLALVASRTLGELASFNVPRLAALAWAFAAADAREEVLLRGIADQCAQEAQHHTPRDSAVLVWAFAALDLSEEKWALGTETALHRAPEKLLEFGSQDLVNTTWAWTRLLQVRPDQGLLGKVAQRATELLPDFGPQGMCNLLWAFSGLKALGPLGIIGGARETNDWQQAEEDLPGPQLLSRAPAENFAQAVARQCLRQTTLKLFGQYHLVMLAWAFAAAMLREEGLLSAVAREALALEERQALNPHGVAGLAWCFAAVLLEPRWVLGAVWRAGGSGENGSEMMGREPGRPLLSGCLAERQQDPAAGGVNSLSSSPTAPLSPPDTVNIMWSLSAMETTEQPLLYCAVLPSLSRRLVEMNARLLTHAVWAQARMALREEPLLGRLATRVLRTGGMTCEATEEFPALCWAFAALGVTPAGLVNELLRAGDETTRRGGVNFGEEAGSWAAATTAVEDLGTRPAVSVEGGIEPKPAHAKSGATTVTTGPLAASCAKPKFSAASPIWDTRSLAGAAWACARLVLGKGVPTLLAGVTEVCFLNLTPEPASPLAPMEASHVASILWALAVLVAPHEGLALRAAIQRGAVRRLATTGNVEDLGRARCVSPTSWLAYLADEGASQQ